MKKMLTLFVFLLVASIYPPKAHAIIFLPAVLLIPIAKIIAVVIGGLSIPSFGVAALITRLFGKSLKRALITASLFLVILIILLSIYLKLQNPIRPWF